MSARLAPASLYVRSSRRGVGGCGVGRVVRGVARLRRAWWLWLWAWGWGLAAGSGVSLGLWSGGWLCSVGGVVRGVARPVDHGADVGLEDMLWYPGSSRCWMACSARWVDTWALGCAR